MSSLSALLVAAIFFLIVRQTSGERERSEQKLTTAVDNMSHGLLLFDSSGRLVMCNQRYIQMYRLSPDVIKPGRSFRDIIAHRKKMGSFNGDVDEHCDALLRDTARGQITREVIEMADGRSIRLLRRPLETADGSSRMKTLPSFGGPRNELPTLHTTMR